MTITVNEKRTYNISEKDFNKFAKRYLDDTKSSCEDVCEQCDEEDTDFELANTMLNIIDDENIPLKDRLLKVVNSNYYEQDIFNENIPDIAGISVQDCSYDIKVS